MSSINSEQSCPICDRTFAPSEIEKHVNKCIFLNSVESKPSASVDVSKRKRSPSPKVLDVKTQPGNSKSPIVVTKSDVSPLKKSKLSVEDPMSFITPLAKQVQPKHIDEFFGQCHVLGPNTVLRALIQKGETPNMILWGPPGCGKTSLSGVVQQHCKTDPKKYKFVGLCAATSGVKEVQNIVTAAKTELRFGRRTVLFMDEIHRFNKRQQDIFLLHVEKGDITLIGATTENPSFCINNALLSRCRVIVMEKLLPNDLVSILERALRSLDVDVFEDQNPNAHRTGEITKLTFEKSAIVWIADTCDGDARIALSNLQLVLQHNKIDENKLITVEDIKEGIKKSHLLYDRKGEEHYNIISAVHKCIRASDDNAALYWLTRMIVSGEDPLFIARRLVRAASEDIGNADPNALQLAVSTMQGCQLIGMPEADVLLAQCTIYLARAPKSREADSALAAAKQLIKGCEGLQPSVPMHLRNAPTKLMKDLGYGRVDPKVKFSNMPSGMEEHDFF